MPLYSYICENGHTIEVKKTALARHPEKCPECGGKLERNWKKDKPAVHYRGSGFTSTDKALDTPVPGYDVDEFSGQPIKPPA